MGEAESGTEAVQACKKTRSAIILMDIGLPGMNGIETITEILRHYPGVKIIILSMYDDEDSVVSAIRSGARVFVMKKASNNDLLDALRIVSRGGCYVSPQVSDRLLIRIQRGDLNSKPATSNLTIFRPANCGCRAWWLKAEPVKRLPSCWTWDCKPSEAIGRP
jgi:DNA-binding NarL/FixJ family response regulator